jgi:hypothetical protein
MDYQHADRVKHLELIQSVVSRLAGNSFLVKGWSLTIASALYAISIQASQWMYAVVGLAAACVFWSLDGYYLRQETLYRHLYDAVRTSDKRIEPYSLSVRGLELQTMPSWKIPLTASQIRFHGPVVVIGTALSILLVV